MEVVVLVGLQASGKTSFFRARFADTHVHISKDNLRNNKHPARRQQQLLATALAEGKSVVIDNTNPTVRDREPLIAAAREANARVIGYYFESRVQECMGRNQERTGRARVPDVALYATIEKLQRPSMAERFDELHYVRLTDGGGFEVLDWMEDGESA